MESGVCAKCTRAGGKRFGYRFLHPGPHTVAVDIPPPCFVCYNCLDAALRVAESRKTSQLPKTRRPSLYSDRPRRRYQPYLDA